MLGYKKTMLLLLAMITISIAVGLAGLRGQTGRRSNRSDARSKEQQQIDFYEQFPLVDYSTPEPADVEQHAKRRAKNKRYDNRSVLPLPHYKDKEQGVQEYNGWETRLSPLPVIESDAIVIGEITNAQAYLSNDKSGVYSEFVTRADEALKSERGQVTAGQLMLVQREGGRVKYPDGEVAKFIIVGQNMPRIGRRYVLFLKSNGEGQDYSILTGYELRAGSVFPLDQPGSKSKFDTYKDLDETTFRRALHDAIAQASRTMP